LANLLAQYLSDREDVWKWFGKKWHIEDKREIYGEIVLRYLNSVPTEIWAVLQLINRAGGIQISDHIQKRTRILAESWRSIGELLKKIYDQQNEDPTYGKTPSSAAFACEALGAIDDYKAAKGSIDFLRRIYNIEKGKIRIDLTGLATLTDFDEILIRMKKQDVQLKIQGKAPLEKGDSIDINSFHRNWLCGIILSAEGALGELDPKILQTIAKAVLKRAHVDGYFHPSRVPWSTARVLIGIGSCGLDLSNPAVKRATEWLMRSRSKGGARENKHWEPWTRDWNTPVETTALCIIGLRKVGVSANNKVLNDATDWLFQDEQVGEWSQLGREFDAALAIEAYTLMGRDFGKIFDKIRWLSEWAESQALWRNVGKTAKETQEQTCLIVQTAAFLVNTMWRILKTDLPGLLKGLGIIEREVSIYGIQKRKTQLDKAQYPTKKTHRLSDIIEEEMPDLGVRYRILANDKDLNNLLSDIQRIHPNYTSHGPDHSKNVINNIELLIPNTMWSKLRPFEICLLLCSAWLHDIGMSDYEGSYELASTEDEKKELRSKFREHHTNRSRDYICKDNNWKRLAVEAFPIAALIGEICRAHDRSVDIPKLEREWPPIKGFDSYGPVRLQLLCALLRLADAMDLGYQRVKEILITVCHVKERYIDSVPHLRGGLLISKVEIKNNFITVYAMPKNEEEKTWVDMLVEDLSKDFESVKGILKDERNGITLNYQGVRVEMISDEKSSATGMENLGKFTM